MKAKKKLVIGLCALLALALLPIPSTLKDGGTKVYQALLYRVELVHRLGPEGGPEFLTGTVVRILGLEVFNSVD